MPDVVTPVQLAWSGGAVLDEPAFDFVTPVVLRWNGVSSGASVSDGADSSFSDGAGEVRLPRLNRQTQYFEPSGFPTTKMITHWQTFCKAIEAAFSGQQGQITDLATIVSRLEAAEVAAQAANDNVANVSREINLANSYPDPPGVLAAGSDGVITIAAHTRRYGDGTSVSVNSGSVSGFAQGDNVTVYYQDTAREGGAVTYEGTTSPVAQAGDTHVVGVVQIPAAGQPPAQGAGVPAPGYMTPEQLEALTDYYRR